MKCLFQTINVIIKTAFKRYTNKKQRKIATKIFFSDKQANTERQSKVSYSKSLVKIKYLSPKATQN